MIEEAKHCWVIHDGVAGNQRQACALAEALGWRFEEKQITTTGFTRLLAPRLPLFNSDPLGDAFANRPAYVIGCGKQAALATRLLKKSGSFAIQILNPRLSSHYWDVVIAPNHDFVQGSNVIECLGSLHSINAEFLKQSRSKASPLAALGSPRTLVLIGGPSRMALFNEGLLEVMFSHLEYDLAEHGGSFIICGSRRTPKMLAEKIRHRFADSGFPVWFDESDGENFYQQALAFSDRIVLTPDSVNMISEACATELPVFIAQPERATGRMKFFLDELQSTRRIKKLTRNLDTFPVTALDTMPEVLKQLKAFLNSP